MGLLADIVKQTNGTPPTTIRSFAPATGELIGEVRITPREEVAAVVARARRAQQAWAVLPVTSAAMASVIERTSGKFHGEITPTTPRGTYVAYARRCFIKWSGYSCDARMRGALFA